MSLPPTPPGPGPLRDFVLPNVQRTVLHNGLTVLSARHGNTRLVSALLVADAGSVREDPAHAGLAALTTKSLDAGAGGRSGEELAWELERLGVEPETEASWDTAWISATVNADKLNAALALLSDLLRRPDFPDAEVARVRSEQLAEILQRRKEPRALANDLILDFLYGRDAAYGRPAVGLADRLTALTRARVTAFHSARFVPAHTALVLVGDFDESTARKAAGTCLADWHGNAAASAPPAPPQVIGGRVIHVVHRPGAVQSEIRAAHAGVARRHPDYFALRVMNTILGGAFTSRLNLNLRERNGFTYGVRSAFAFRRAPGPFIIQTAVATEVTDRAIAEILIEVNLLRAGGVSAEEVVNARDYLAGGLPLELQTTQQVASRVADIAIHELPDDYLLDFRDDIQAVSVDDVQRVARMYLQPERFTFCVVGDADAIAQPLTGLGHAPVQIHAPPA